MKHENITLWLPEPEAFFLQKILTSQKRKNEAKKTRDLSTGKIIGELCLYTEDHNSKMKTIFNSLPKMAKDYIAYPKRTFI